MKNSLILWLLFFFTFLIYNVNFQVVGASDSIPTRLLPFSILSGNGIYMDQYIKFLGGNLYYFLKYQGHYIPTYPLMTGILLVPLYFPFYVGMVAHGLANNETFFQTAVILEKVGASIIASLAVCFIYLLFYKISSHKAVSILFSLIFAFATQNFSISSQALWQHGGANLFMIISSLFFVNGIKNKLCRQFSFFLALLFAILAFWTRLNFLIYLILLLSLVMWIDRRRTLFYAQVFLLGISLLFLLNFRLYHSFLGGYTLITQMNGVSDFWTGFWGLLISPGRGTLFYTPFFFFSFGAIYFFRKILINQTDRYIFILMYCYFIAGAILNFFWGGWWGGWSWGNRLLTDIAVAAVILSYFFYKFVKSYLFRFLFFTAISYSVFIQALGVFCYPNTYWDSIPNDINNHQERLWVFGDGPIMRSIQKGPNLMGIKIAISLLVR